MNGVAWRGCYLRWNTLCAYICVAVITWSGVQSARNGVLLNGPDSRTISPDALLDRVRPRFHLHGAVIGTNRKWSSHRRKTFDNMRPDGMHNACWSISSTLIVHLLRNSQHLQFNSFKSTQSDIDSVVKCIFTQLFIHRFRQIKNINQSLYLIS